MPDDLTRPERSAQFAEARRHLRHVIERGGCPFCIHRDPTVIGWGRAVCQAAPKRAFPLCLKDGATPAFEVDETTLQRKP